MRTRQELRPKEKKGRRDSKLQGKRRSEFRHNVRLSSNITDKKENLDLKKLLRLKRRLELRWRLELRLNVEKEKRRPDFTEKSKNVFVMSSKQELRKKEDNEKLNFMLIVRNKPEKPRSIKLNKREEEFNLKLNSRLKDKKERDWLRKLMKRIREFKPRDKPNMRNSLLKEKQKCNKLVLMLKMLEEKLRKKWLLRKPGEKLKLRHIARKWRQEQHSGELNKRESESKLSRELKPNVSTVS